MAKLEDISIHFFDPYTNETYVGSLDIQGMQSSEDVPKENSVKLHEDPKGASTYIVVVLLVYGLSIIFLIASHVLIKKKEQRLDGQVRTAKKYFQEIPSVRERGARESYKKLKHSIVPVVAKSGARDLVSRRKSFMPILAEAGIRLDTESISKLISPTDSVESHLSGTLSPPWTPTLPRPRLQSIAESDEHEEPTFSNRSDDQESAIYLPAITIVPPHTGEKMESDRPSFGERRPSSASICRSIDSINSAHNGNVDNILLNGAKYAGQNQLQLPNGDATPIRSKSPSLLSPPLNPRKVTFHRAYDKPRRFLSLPKSDCFKPSSLMRKPDSHGSLNMLERATVRPACSDEQIRIHASGPSQTCEVNGGDYPQQNTDANDAEGINQSEESTTVVNEICFPVVFDRSTGQRDLSHDSASMDESLHDSEDELLDALTSAYEFNQLLDSGDLRDVSHSSNTGNCSQKQM